MRIHIIKLEKHDDVISTRDKLAWGKAARVLLEWPGDAKILTRRIDLVILQRYCQSQGSHLGLVSQNHQVRDNARLLGIPIFSNEKKALKARWARKSPPLKGESHVLPDLRMMGQEIRSNPTGTNNGHKGRRVDFRWIRFGFFAAGIFAVLALAGTFYPSATIELSPQTKNQEINLKVLASSQIKTVNISGSLPARTMAAIVEGQDTIPVTGSANIPTQYAFGEVQFTNLGNQTVTIPVGTIVDAVDEPNARFMTTKAGAVVGGRGGTSSIPIRALQPGKVGNLPSGAINAIEGSLGLQLTATNLSPTTGGSDQTAPAVSESDYNSLRSRLLQNLKQTAFEQITSKLGSGDLLIQDSLDLKDILDEESSPGINQPADNLSLSLRIEYTALYISGEDLQALGNANLDAALERNYLPVAGSLKIQSLEDPLIGTDQVVQCEIKVSRVIQLYLSGEKVAGMVLGKTPEAASLILTRDLPLKTAARVKMTPNWWPQLPILAFRITILQGMYADSGS